MVTHCVGHDFDADLDHDRGCGTSTAAERDSENMTGTTIMDWWSRRRGGVTMKGLGSRAPSRATTSPRNSWGQSLL